MYSCRLRVNPLRRSKTVRQIFNLIYLPDSVTIMTLFHQQEEMEFDLDVTSVPSGGSETLTIVIEARTKGVASMGKQPRFNLTIPLRTAIDLEVSGYVNRVRLIKIWYWMGSILNRNSVDEQRSYNRPNETDLSTVKESIVFQHLYEVSYWSLHSLLRKFAQAECFYSGAQRTAQPCKRNKYWSFAPHSCAEPAGDTVDAIFNARKHISPSLASHVHYFINAFTLKALRYIPGKSEQRSKQYQVQPQLHFRPIDKLRRIPSVDSSRSKYKCENKSVNRLWIRFIFFLGQPEYKFALANRTAFIDCFNTRGIVCVKYVCPVTGPLTPETPITVALTGNLHLHNIRIPSMFPLRGKNKSQINFHHFS